MILGSNNYSFRHLEWDTEYFGVKSGKIELFNELTVQDQEIIEVLDSFEFTTIYNYFNNNKNNTWIGEIRKASLKDVNVQFYLRLEEQNHCFAEDSNIIIDNNMDKNDDIIDMASNSFLFSRFFNDEKLNIDKSANIYRQWVTTAFKQENRYFLYYQYRGRTIAFILFNFYDSEATIELIAVNKLNAGKGIGSKMIGYLKHYLFDRGIEVLKVGTQINNVGAINFYIALGFRYSHCTGVYHYWRS